MMRSMLNEEGHRAKMEVWKVMDRATAREGGEVKTDIRGSFRARGVK